MSKIEMIIRCLLGGAGVGLAFYIIPAWFLGIIIGVPLLVMSIGAVGEALSEAK